MQFRLTSLSLGLGQRYRLASPRNLRGESANSDQTNLPIDQGLTPLLFHLHGGSTVKMPKDQSRHSVPRQRPISCRFCRTRKLRCSREAPCSNCVSRGVHCELEQSPEGSSGTPTATELKLLERIRKLEERVETQDLQDGESVKHPEDFVTCAQQRYLSTAVNGTEHLDDDVAWLESIYADQSASVYDFVTR